QQFFAMPQPFPKYLKNPQFEVGDGASKRPALFYLGMSIIGAHSKNDAVLNTAMFHLLGADPEPALLMLTAIKNNNIKLAAYTELANETLTEPDLSIFQGVIKRFAATEKERNRLAHDLWAIEPQPPDAVVLISAREFSKIKAKKHLLRGNRPLSAESLDGLINNIRSSGLVYTKEDFIRILKQMNRVFFLVVALSIMLDRETPDHEVSNQRQQLQEALQTD
ncbi:MAG: hypothetical protein AAF683_01965, partial [Pseudomonadota bacterium]